jgi:tRNA1(Val) A37 N6-methylase TrmN6
LRAEPFDLTDLTRDAFLGGQVQLWQPRDGYRSGTDPVLLAAATPARPGQSVLELGCGAGAALCCLGARVPGLTLSAIELQPAYADLARRNLDENHLQGRIWAGDLSAPPAELNQLSFDHVMANPPYFEPGKRIGAEAADREVALAGSTPLADWVRLAARRLRPRGYATFIQRAERLPDLLAALQGHLGAIELLPLLPRAGRPPRLILVRARKEGRAPFVFHAGAVIHAGDTHVEPGSHYTPLFDAVLQRAAPLPFSH